VGTVKFVTTGVWSMLPARGGRQRWPRSAIGADLAPSVSCTDDARRPEMPVTGGPLRLRVLSKLLMTVAGDGIGSGWRGTPLPLGWMGGNPDLVESGLRRPHQSPALPWLLQAIGGGADWSDYML